MKKTELEKKHLQLKKNIQTNQHAPFPSFKGMAYKSSCDMIGGIIVGTGGGIVFDRFFQTPHWGLIVGFILGSTAGLLNVYRGLCKVGCGFGRNKRV